MNRALRLRGGIEEQTRKLFEVYRLRRTELDLPQQPRPRGTRPVRRLEFAAHDQVIEPVCCNGLDDPELRGCSGKPPAPNGAKRF